MKPSEDLFQLIKSLTKSEKRYFKLFVSKKHAGTNNYLKLFNALEKQISYDEKKIIRKFSGTTFIKHLPSEKNYLYNLIFKSLHLFYSGSSAETATEELLHGAEILYRKGLFRQSRKITERAMSFALKNELYGQSLRIAKSQIRFGKLSDSSDTMQLDFKDALSHARLALEKLENLLRFNELYATFFLFLRKEGEAIRAPADLERIKDILHHPLLAKEENAHSTEAKEIFYFIKSICFYMCGDFEKALGLYKKGFKYIDSSPDHAPTISRYTASLSNISEFALRAKKYKTFWIYLNKLRAVTSQFSAEQSEQFYRYYDLLLRLYVQTGKFKKAISLIQEIENGILRFQEHIHKSRIISFYYYIAYAFFGAGEYKKALWWINKALSDKSDLRKDILGFARILNFLIHYELGNHALLEHLYNAAYRYISTRKKLYLLEIHMLKFLRKLSKETEPRLVMLSLKKELLPLVKNSFEMPAFQYIDILSWLESKLEQKHFSDIVKSKNKAASE